MISDSKQNKTLSDEYDEMLLRQNTIRRNYFQQPSQ